MEIKEVAEWFDIASTELDTAFDIFNKYRPNLELAYYLCSQSIEKHLKGYLIFNNISFSQKHDLSIFNNLCINIDNNFDKFKTSFKIISNIANKLRYPTRVQINKEDVEYAFETAGMIKNFEPINNIYITIKNNYGNNWQEVLFGKQDPEKLESIEHYKYEKTENENITKKIENINKIIHLESISGIESINNKTTIDKYRYLNTKENYVYLLIRMNYNNNQCETWYFEENFNKTSAIEFLKQWDHLQKNPAGDKNTKV